MSGGTGGGYSAQSTATSGTGQIGGAMFGAVNTGGGLSPLTLAIIAAAVVLVFVVLKRK